ncbi:hypothetical protein F5Y03DRAFT_393882 [Xylaria venustula]|nr:hypothetical protein F5Y03DRAFT_393882 [Xylaria venustula]
MSNSPRINTHNLGSANEALHSHPITKHEAEKIVRNRDFIIYESENDGHIILKGTKDSRDLSAERPTFSEVIRDAALTESSDRKNLEDEEKTGEKPTDTAVPIIHLAPPPEGDVQQVDTGHLCINVAYRDLHQRSHVENRVLHHMVRDLKGEIELLKGLLPLATTLCVDQGIECDITKLGTLQPALETVLADFRRAKHAATHHKRRKKELEARVRELEGELADLRRARDEDRMRR